jgi:hypothetical protein
VKDDVSLVEHPLVGDDVARVQGRQKMLEQVFAARCCLSVRASGEILLA